MLFRSGVLPRETAALIDHARKLELPLRCGVTVIAAHCATKGALFDGQWFPAFVAMAREFPNLYGDNSAFCVPNHRIRGRVVPDCLAEPLASRIVHGSDWPVPVSGFWPWAKALITAAQWRAARRETNALERDAMLKRAMGFAPETFTRVWGLIPPAVREAKLRALAAKPR